jgi:predicted HD phosphohydrolase
MALTLQDIEQIFLERGHRSYDGESVSHLRHALQTAALAERNGAGAHLITASLLHDLGHLIADRPGTPTLRGIDDKHQYFVLPFLRGLFSSAVLDPIRLHVEAKR